MPKHKIEGTHVAVNKPSSLFPENHKYADTAKEISTAIKMNISETLTIDPLLLQLFLSYFSQKPQAATINEPTANPACDRNSVSPGISNTKGTSSRIPNGSHTANKTAQSTAIQPSLALNFDRPTLTPFNSTVKIGLGECRIVQC
jgi:hypothetical protein